MTFSSFISVNFHIGLHVKAAQVKQPLATIKITEAAIDKCFFKKAKSKKVGTKIKFTGYGLLV